MDRSVTFPMALGFLIAIPYLFFLILYTIFRPNESPAQKEYTTEPTVSVLVPTYNEAEIIKRKLDDICGLDYPLEKIEIVLADASDDGTRDVVRDEILAMDPPKPDLTIVTQEERTGVAPAINMALKEASGEIIFRTDSDSILEEDVLREAVANLADPEIGAVTGRQSEVLGESEVESDYRSILSRVQALESTLDSTFIFHGPCFAFAREDFEPIDSDSLADDTEVALRIRRAGKRVIMDPAMKFVESGVSDFRQRRSRKDRRAMGLVQLLIRNKDMLGRYGWFGRVVLPFNWWFMILTPWLSLFTILTATKAAIVVSGPLGLVLPVGVVGFTWLGQRDQLGWIQPFYALVDAQVSLLVAQISHLRNDITGQWEIDRKSREPFK